MLTPKKAMTIGITGFEGGKLKSMAKECLIVPSHSMKQIEDIHFILEHLITFWLSRVI